METTNSMETYNKVAEPKVIDTVNLCGKYINASAFKTKVITASATSAIIAAGVAAYVLFF